ncbi:MAG: hypothetical protein JOZ69_17115 [Myxococcales bacterium]|nr:hypothetical protein [Myxococcales bacterium]
MRYRLLAVIVGSMALLSCVDAGPRAPVRAPGGSRDPSGLAFLDSALRPYPDAASPGLIAVTDAATGRVATYDSALVVLVLLRSGRRDRAARVLQGLSALQREDGGLPFSFTLPAPDPGERYERTGAVAWVGYAAAEYLDAERGGPARDVALALAHRAAQYVLGHQVTRAGDPRDGLVRGGVGTFRYELAGDDVREVLEPGEVSWTAVEHNVDSYFFLRALARVTGTAAYDDAARRIAGALQERAWNGDEGQFWSGLDEGGPDPTLALDCASWGSILLDALAARARARTAFAVADGRYASQDPATGARGHVPYASGPLIADERLMRHFQPKLPAARWEDLRAVWPEGTAGVALAAWRAGRPDRARALLDALEPLRSADGSLPTATAEIPFVLDTRPSIGGTAWVALVRFELDRPPSKPTLWAP